MNQVFIGGSRMITRLPQTVQERLDKLIQNQLPVLIGDANGADKGVQAYLAQQQYPHVTVYCMLHSCRNNVGQWEVKSVEAQKGDKGLTYFARKDEQMARDAAYGLMLWDGQSNGTLNNMLNLLAEDKKVVVFLSRDESWHTLRNADDLTKLLATCDAVALTTFEKKLNLSARMGAQQLDLLAA
ncbi:MAG: hypothetical protein HOP19_25850 [Acidobacteria bacterium]|nr:hypothetical protein [Acidobacteriota bacterium]